MKLEKDVLLSAMREAGQAILVLQENGYTTSRKANYDLLTEADLEANRIIKSAITKHFPNDGWLSEECVDDQDRLSKSRIWIVDPIDGTLEFAKNVPEYAISVALVENGQPILASVYNPARSEFFYAIKGQGAWQDETRLSCCAGINERLRLLASRSEWNRGEWKPFVSHEVQVVGSIAYKLALVAKGEADATFSLGPKSEWDIAAGVLLVQEAGGIVTDRYQKPFTFNQAEVRVNSIVACSHASYAKIIALINDV